MCENSKRKGEGRGEKSDLIFVHAQHRKKLQRVVQLDNPMQCETERERERGKKCKSDSTKIKSRKKSSEDREQ